MKSGIKIFVIALLGGAAALGINSLFNSANTPQTLEEKQNVHFTNQQDLVNGTQIDFVEVAEMATPTVVHIKTTVEVAEGNQEMEFYDPFGFFDRPLMPRGPQQGSGSGVIITRDGYIATNNHVIANASKIEVILNDKRTYHAELIGSDPETDLALLKIEEKNLPFLGFGNSDELKIGEWVIAVGNPFNLTSTVTAGIVSAKGRSINLLRQNNQYAIENFIQTDAAVNPGNSGGALVNTRGQLIGINTAIASQTGSYSGYSFAVPVNLAKKILDDLLKYGEVKRALLGVQIQDVTAELAEEKGLKKIAGVYVPGVAENSAADKAGIKAGDVILKVEDEEVNKSSSLQEKISKYHPGDKVKIQLLRDDKTIEKVVTLQSKDGKTEIVTDSQRAETRVMGALLENLTRQEKADLKIRHGVRVKKLNPGPFREKHIPEGFVITHIDKQRVYTTKDVETALEKKEGSVLIDGVSPDGKPDSFAIRVTKG